MLIRQNITKNVAKNFALKLNCLLLFTNLLSEKYTRTNKKQ